MNSKTHTIEQVNQMSHYDLAYSWRFAKPGEWIIGDPVTERAQERLFKELGGFNPQLSKQLGWTS